MTLFENEEDLLARLDEHDALLVDCAEGRIDFGKFLRCYDSFPMRFALDGHESDDEERELFRKHRARCAVHWRVITEVETGLCSDTDALLPAYQQAHRFGSAEALRRVRVIVSEELAHPPFQAPSG